MARRQSKAKTQRFFVHHDLHPQTLTVLRTRAEPVGIELVVGDVDRLDDEAGVFGAIFGHPGSSGVGHRLDRHDRVGPRAGCRRDRGDRPARLCDRHAPRPDGGRHRGRLGATLRRAHGLRWAACGVRRRPREGGALDARSHRRGQRRHRRAPRAAPGVADARAAHPPREGDVQHLHGAGAAGEHRRAVRGVARPLRARAHRGTCAAAHVDRRSRTPGRRSGAASRLVVRHAERRAPQRRRRHARGGGTPSRAEHPAHRRFGSRAHLRRDQHAGDRRDDRASARRCARALGGMGHGTRRALEPISAAATISSPSPCSTAITRNTRCSATCAG